MSEHTRILEKYEQMFEDGSAFKPIHLSQPQPNMSEVTGAGAEVPDTPLGDPVKKDQFNDDQNHADYTEFDNQMESRVNEMRDNRNMHSNTSNVGVQNNSEVESLKKRLDLVEQALSLVMETQKTLIKG